MAKTFDVWAHQLFMGITDQGVKKAQVCIPVQHDGGYQNEFLFAERFPITPVVWDSLESHQQFQKDKEQQQRQEEEPIPTCVLVNR